MAAIQLLGTYFAARDQPQRRGLDALAIGLLLAGPAILAVRRRHPLGALAGVAAVSLTYLWLDYAYGPFVVSLLIAVVTAVIAGHRWAAWAVALALYLAHFGLRFGWHRRPAVSLGEMIGTAAWLLVVLGMAEQIRVRRERALESRRAGQEVARRRAGEERLKIARELHDTLAHNISLINVQAGVALHLLDEDPQQARTSLTAIKQASKDALTELRSVLGILRGPDEQAPLSPAPSLARLDELVSQAAAAGLQVRTEIGGRPRPLPTGIDRAAFRIVQEGLTNIVRHAGPAAATVRVGYLEEEITVIVDDDGAGGETGHENAGSGIAGMRERATALGGDLVAGPREGGGFRVQARLPFGVAE